MVALEALRVGGCGSSLSSRRVAGPDAWAYVRRRRRLGLSLLPGARLLMARALNLESIPCRDLTEALRAVSSIQPSGPGSEETCSAKGSTRRTGTISERRPTRR